MDDERNTGTHGFHRGTLANLQEGADVYINLVLQ
jgi:hypothetical protein